MDNGASSYRRFLSGDDEGFSEIVREYRDGLQRFLSGFVGNPDTAEELTEETFFRLLIKKPRFRGDASFKSWLYAIGRNVAVDWIRRRRKELSLTDELRDAIPDDSADPERLTWAEERRRLVHRAMRTLPAEYRQVLLLSYYDGLPNREIARVLRKNGRQVSNLLYRAKQSLKTELEKGGFVYEELG